MAVTTHENVLRIAADNDTITGIQNVVGILYIPGASGQSASIKKTDTSGMVLWEASGSARIYDDVQIRLTGTTHFDLAGTGTVLYLYTKTC